MRKNLALALPAIYAGMTALIGCGGGSSVAPPAQGTILKGTATVPAGTATRLVRRASGPDVVLPGATVNVYDITTGGLNALNGAPTKTTQTGSDGSYKVTGLAPGHNYVVTITKSVTDGSGNKINLSLGAYVHLPTTASVPTTAAVNYSTTVASNYIVKTLTSDPTESSIDLTDVFNTFVTTVIAQIQQGTITTQDLSKSFTDPQTYANLITQITQNSLKDAAYIDNGTNNSRRDIVCLMASKTRMKVKTVLIVQDATGNVFDADYYDGALNTDGTFSGTTTDGLYNITGAISGDNAHGKWTSIDGTLSGRWEAHAATGHAAGVTPPTYRGAGYQGKFYKASSTSPEGVWFFFVRSDGNAIMMAHDEARAGLTHLRKTTVITGAVDASGHVSGNMVFPAVATNGMLTGIDPAEGGAATGTGSATLGTSHSASGTVGVTGTIANGGVSGAWSFSGTRDGKPYSNSGTWDGSTF